MAGAAQSIPGPGHQRRRRQRRRTSSSLSSSASATTAAAAATATASSTTGVLLLLLLHCLAWAPPLPTADAFLVPSRAPTTTHHAHAHAHARARTRPRLHAHDHHHDHEDDDEDEEPVPLTLLTGLPSALAAAVPSLVRKQEGRLGVVVAARQPGGLLASLVKLQEELEGEVDENGFVLCSLGSVDGKGTEAVAEGMRMAAATLAEEQGPLSRVLLLGPPTLDPLTAAEVLSGHTHDHDHDHDHGDSCGCDSDDGRVRLAGLMAAVDARTFAEDWWRAEPLEARGDLALLSSPADDAAAAAAAQQEEGEDEEEEEEEELNTVADLLCAQVESAGRVWVVMDEGEDGEKAAGAVATAVQCLNPGADVWPMEVGEDGPFPLIDPMEEGLGVGAFDVHTVEEGAGWLRLLNEEGFEREDDDGAEDGTWGLVFKARRPFHPQRLWAFMTRPDGVMAQRKVLRSKGFFWLATRHDEVGLWSQVGGSFAPGSAGPWWCVTDREEWPEGGEEEVEADFEGAYGDRRQEIAFLGVVGGGGGGNEVNEVNEVKRALIEGLEGCLLSEFEYAAGPDGWGEGGMEDPFPEWE